jgi:hypothetical protein
VAGIVLTAIGITAWFQSQVSILLEWSTESEFEIVGFDILRWESDSGPFIKVNDNIIPPSIDPMIGGEYQFIDTNVEPGQVYYYILEDIEMDGTRQSHGPVIQEADNHIFTILFLCGIFLIILGICSRDYRKKKRDQTNKT